MTHDCDGGKEETSTQGWSARFFEKIGVYSFHLPFYPS